MSTEQQITWEEYRTAVEKLCKKIVSSKTKFSVIVGLTRGGLIPAVILSHSSGIQMFAFDPHWLHSDGTARQQVQLPIDPAVTRSILVIDDISDSGKTLDKVSKFFTARGFNVETAAVFINSKTTCHTPNYSVMDSKKQWIVFPYEKSEQ